MQLADLLRETLDEDSQDVRENERPDTHPAVWDASPYGGAVDQGDSRTLRIIGCRTLSWRSLELGSYVV